MPKAKSAPAGALDFSINVSKLPFEQQVLMSAISEKPREFLLVHPEFKLTAAQQKKFLAACADLAKGQPLAYVLGYQWFFGRKFTVNKNVLIPRPETEQLVEIALEFCKQNSPDLVIDVGTGSGAIIASIAANLPIDQRKSCKLFGIDVSEKALAIARKNGKGLSIKFIKGSLLKPLGKQISKQIKNNPGQPILITANLPYLSKKELSEPTIKKEPKLALYGGKPSHSLIEQLLKQIAELRITNGLVLLEFNYNQGVAIKKLAKKNLPAAHCEIKKDLRGFDRIGVIRLNTGLGLRTAL